MIVKILAGIFVVFSTWIILYFITLLIGVIVNEIYKLKK